MICGLFLLHLLIYIYYYITYIYIQFEWVDLTPSLSFS